MEPKTYDNSKQLKQETQQVTHTVLNADKHPIIHNTIQQDKGSIVKNINDANSHQHNAATQQDNIPRDVEENPTNFSGPKIVELSKYCREIQKDSQDEAVVQITDLLQEYKTLFPLNNIERKGMVEDLERMKIPLRS